MGGDGGKCSLVISDPAYKRMTEGEWPFQTSAQTETSTGIRYTLANNDYSL